MTLLGSRESQRAQSEKNNNLKPNKNSSGSINLDEPTQNELINELDWPALVSKTFIADVLCFSMLSLHSLVSNIVNKKSPLHYE